MSFRQEVITIGMVVLGTMLTRFLPFILFPDNKPTPPVIKRIGKVFPSAIMGMLVIYCYRQLPSIGWDSGLLQVIAGLVVAVVHVKWRNMLVSIASGTVVYMLLLYGLV